MHSRVARFGSTPCEGPCSAKWTVAITAAFLFVALAILPTLSIRAADIPLITPEGERHLLGPPAAPRVGSTTPTVSIVEYFDYNCPVCRALAPTLQTLLSSDLAIAVVYKDWPILGPVSIYAARCALAAKWQDKYVQAHAALMGGPHLTNNSQVDASLAKAGIDMTRLKSDRDRHAGTLDALLEHNNAEADALGLRGTPGLVVGRQLIAGSVDLATLRTLVSNVRHP